MIPLDERRRRLRVGATRRIADLGQRRATGRLASAIIRRVGPDVLRPVGEHPDLERPRPVFFPQHGRGIRRLEIDSLRTSALDASSLHRLQLADRVVVPAAAVSDPAAVPALVTLASSGVPLELSEPVVGCDSRLGPDTTSAIASPHRHGRLEREQRSVALRRAALREHPHPLGADESGTGRAAVPAMSVLLASRRPEHLLGAVDQIAAQRHVTAELIVGLHGSSWSPDWRDRLVDRWSGTLRVVHADETVSFGELLTDLGRRSDGELVTKWDDDDWYGPDHLIDLALAHRYSGADLVGKAAEFVYLTTADTTVRRFPTGAETYSSSLAGGTLTAARSWFEFLGWWPPMARNVDLHIIDSTERAGGRCYRTHGFQYVLRRSATPDDHTWAATDEYFLATGASRRDGLDLSFAGFEQP